MQDAQAAYGELPREHELLSVVAEIADIAGGREDAAVVLARKLLTRMFEVTGARCGLLSLFPHPVACAESSRSQNSRGSSACCRLHTGATAAALEILRDSACKRLPLEVTAMWAALADERKWRRDAGETLLRARLLSLPDLDAHLAKVEMPLCRLVQGGQSPRDC